MSAQPMDWVDARNLRLSARLSRIQPDLGSHGLIREGILDNFSRPLDRLESEVMAALSELSVRVARSLVSRAYQADPLLLVELVRAAVDAVGGTSREVEVRMHPDDIAALAPLLELPEATRLTGDTSLGRGDLRVHAENMRIDGSLDARLEGALAAVLSRQAQP